MSMGETGSGVMAGVYTSLLTRCEASHTGLSVQRVSGNCVRVDRFDNLGPWDQPGFLSYSPIMFFLVSYDKLRPSLVKLQLMTYNEQVFDSLEFEVEKMSELFSFITSKLCDVTFSNCSGVRKENIKPRKLRKYLGDDDTLFEKYGERLVFRSVRCQRIIENEVSSDLCSFCKSWLIAMETNSSIEFETPLTDEDFSPSENNVVKYQNGDDDFDIDSKPYRRSYKRRSEENSVKAKRKRMKIRKLEKLNGVHDVPDEANDPTHDGADDTQYMEEMTGRVKTPEHRSVHKRHECPEEGCRERFKILRGKLMRRHLETVHGQVLDKPRGSYYCDKCDKKFKTFEILQKHIKGVHESTHIPCYICAKLVKEGTPMEHHIKYVHIQPNQFE